MNIFKLVGTIALTGAEAAEKQLQGLEAFAKKNEKTFKTMGTAMTVAGGAIVGALSLAVKSAQDETINIQRLTQSLSNVGIAYDDVKDSLESVISATQRKTGIADSEQRDILGRLVLVTNDYNKALSLLPLALDLAAAGQMDANTAATYLSKAMLDLEGGAESVSIRLGQATVQFKSLAEIQERVGGAAQAAANPFKILAAEIGDLTEEIGKSLLPTIRALIEDRIVPLIGKIKSWIDANPALTKGIVVFTGAVGALMLGLGPLLIIFPQLVAGFVALKMAILGVRLVTIEWTVIVLAAITAGYAMLNLVRSIKSGMSGGAWETEGTIFDAIKRDVGTLMSKLGELLPASNAAIEETTTKGKAGFDNLAGGIGGTTQKLEEFNQKAQETRDAERRLALDFTELWRNLIYGETKAGQLNLTMEDIYTTLYKLGYGVEDIGKVFEKYQGRQDAVNQVLQEYGLTAEQVAKMVGKLREETDKQTESILRQADATNKAKQAALPGGLFMTPWGVIVAKGERALGPGDRGKQPEYIGGQGLTGKFYAQGGMIEEPTLLTRLRDMKPYGVAGESGPERVVPGRGGVTININHPTVRNDRDITKLGEELVRVIRLQQGLRGI